MSMTVETKAMQDLIKTANYVQLVYNKKGPEAARHVLAQVVEQSQALIHHLNHLPPTQGERPTC